MSLDYDIHLNSAKFESLFDNPDDEDQERHPFFEDPAELERIIEEEIGSPRRKGRKRRR